MQGLEKLESCSFKVTNTDYLYSYSASRTHVNCFGISITWLHVFWATIFFCFSLCSRKGSVRKPATKNKYSQILILLLYNFCRILSLSFYSFLFKYNFCMICFICFNKFLFIFITLTFQQPILVLVKKPLLAFLMF